MYKEKTILALIPARGGSKGLPGKNVRDFMGKPLIAWSIELALRCRYLDGVIVSTDSHEIGEISKKYGAEVQDRPAYLSDDSALVADVIIYALDTLARTSRKFDYVLILQPTSPLRSMATVEHCIERIIDEGADSIATFSESETPPSRLWTIESGVVKLMRDGDNPWLPRQHHSKSYFLNGLAYVFKANSISKDTYGSIFNGHRIPVITRERIVDIDTLEEFELAELLMREKHENRK